MTRNKILSGTVIAAFAAILLAWAPSTAYAGANGADVLRFTDEICQFIDGNGSIVLVEGGHGNVVTTNSHNGNVNGFCKAKGVPNDTGAEVVWNFGNTDLLCVIGGVITQNWEITVSEDGNAIFHCHAKI